MSDDRKHSDGVVHSLFCGLRTKPKSKCKDGQNYVKNCKPSNWGAFSFTQLKTNKKTRKREKKPKVFEAHHLLCVASVSEVIVGTSKKSSGIRAIVKQTKWCINRKKNMYAMPLWGHTIKWYCDVESKQLKTAISRIKKGRIKEPKFSGIPQHDYGHNTYIKEVKKELADIVKSVKKERTLHKDPVGTLVSELNSASDHFKGELGARGSSREGGTHKAWTDAKNKKNLGAWYKPFSMAPNGQEKFRQFPCPGFSSPVARKINALVNALKGG